MSDWTTIPDSDCDADSPVDEDLMGDLKENVEYLYERAVRGGTHATGVRVVLARGTITDTSLTDGAGDIWNQTVALSFSTAIDGDPNFDSAPVVVVTPEESSASTDWGTTWQVSASIVEGTRTASGCTIEWTIRSGPASSTIGVVLNWIAVGLPTAGE